MRRYDLTPAYAQNLLNDDSDPEDSRPWVILRRVASSYTVSLKYMRMHTLSYETAGAVPSCAHTRDRRVTRFFWGAPRLPRRTRWRGRILHKSKLELDDPIGEANDAYGTFGIETPTYLPLRDGRLVQRPQKVAPNLSRRSRGGSQRPRRGEKKTAVKAAATY